MRAYFDRVKSIGRRATGGVQHDLAASSDRRWLSRPRLLSLSALVLVVGAVALLARAHGVEDPLASGSARASMPAGPLTRTKLVGLPPRTIRDGAAALTVTLSAPAAPSSPRPILRPAVAGAWSDVGNTEVFTPASTLEPCSSYTLTVWANTIATGHTRVGHRHTIGMNVACPSIAALQQGLARLGFLGASFHPRYSVARVAAGPESRHDAAVHAFHAPHGRLVPEPSSAPRVETGRLDETTRGALVVFQSDHRLESTGEPDRATWASLLAAETTDRRNPTPYTWVSVSESIPETLEVHRGHHVALRTPANTGVPGAETAQGIFPIFTRDVSTTMTGTNPDGTHYSDPGVPWVNYFNGGDAVHGFPRGSYGTPQSNGCVELPIETAHTVYGMLALGDIVEVTG
jgi:peptidoglycan hydrolase-like protein with peptidoglycan-binding domain